MEQTRYTSAMSKDELLKHLNYHYWATQQMLTSCKELSEAELLQETGSAFGNIKGILVHMLGAEDIWLTRWQGKAGISFPAPEDYTDLSHIEREWYGQRQRIEAFLQGADTDSLMAIRDHQHALWEMVLHMIDHSSFHRGQVMHFIRSFGYTPLSSNLIHYLRQ